MSLWIFGVLNSEKRYTLVELPCNRTFISRLFFPHWYKYRNYRLGYLLYRLRLSRIQNIRSEEIFMKEDTLALIIGLVMFATTFFIAGIAVGAALC